MRRMHMNAVLAVRDFNISPAMIEEFDLRRGFADQPDPAGVDRLLNPNYAKGRCTGSDPHPRGCRSVHAGASRRG